jgi:hypothetical protein
MLRPWAVAVAVGLVTLGIALATVSPYVVGSFQDDGIYVILGRALATGAGYRYLHLPGMPAATHYPPVYPALLALLWRIAPHFPENVVVFERANAVLLGVSAVLGVALARRAGLTTPWACAVASLGTVSIPPLALASMVLSESAFLAALLGALVAAETLSAGPAPQSPLAPTGTRPPEHSFGRACATGLLCGVVVLVRTVGAAILPAAVGVCLLRRRWRTAIGLVLGALVVLAPWQVWLATHAGDLAPILQGEYGSYSGWLTGALHRHGPSFAWATVRLNFADLVTTLATQLAPGLPVPVKLAALVAFSVLVGWGTVTLVRRAPVTATFGALYLGIVLLWPFPPFRFVWAIWILVMLAVAVAIASIVDWRPATAGAGVTRRGALLCGAAIVLCVVRYNILGYRYHWWSTMQSSLSAHSVRPLAWLATHPDLPGVTMSEIEPTIYLYTGRVGVPCNAFTPDEYIYPRDTTRDRVVLDAALRRFPVGSVIATGPACALAALRIAGAPPQPLIAIDTTSIGLAVFARSRQ